MYKCLFALCAITFAAGANAQSCGNYGTLYNSDFTPPNTSAVWYGLGGGPTDCQEIAANPAMGVTCNGTIDFASAMFTGGASMDSNNVCSFTCGTISCKIRANSNGLPVELMGFEVDQETLD